MNLLVKILDTEKPPRGVHGEVNAVQTLIALLAAKAGRAVAVAERSNNSVQNRLCTDAALVQRALRKRTN